jgi:hypothetical protein
MAGYIMGCIFKKNSFPMFPTVPVLNPHSSDFLVLAKLPSFPVPWFPPFPLLFLVMSFAAAFPYLRNCRV